MKRIYRKPSTTIVFMEIEGNLLMDSAMAQATKVSVGEPI